MDLPDVYPVDGNFGSLGRLSSHGRKKITAMMTSGEDSPNRTVGMRRKKCELTWYTIHPIQNKNETEESI